MPKRDIIIGTVVILCLIAVTAYVVMSIVQHGT
jgi:hypothetical protein